MKKMNYIPSIDKNFTPLILKLEEFKEKVSVSDKTNELIICLERNQGYNYFYKIDIFKDGTGHDEENYEIVERIVKSLLWVVGGYKIYVKGSELIFKRLYDDYLVNGKRRIIIEG